MGSETTALEKLPGYSYLSVSIRVRVEHAITSERNVINIDTGCRFAVQYRDTCLSVDEGDANGVVTDERAKPLPDVAQLDEKGLHYLVAGYQGLPPRPVDDIRRPDEWHPIFRHRGLLVHHFEDLLLGFHHQTWKHQRNVRSFSLH